MRRSAGILLSALVVAALAATPAAAQMDHSKMDHSAQAPKPPTDEKLSTLTIPDVPVITQDGERVSFYSDLVADNVVAMNFIFTTCTTICPPMGATFSRLQDMLAENGDSAVRLISVSVDPVVDTPERLKEWGERFGAGPEWTLVTGEPQDVTRLLKSLQVFTPDYEDHSPTVLVGDDAHDEWIRTYGLAPPKKLADLLAGITKESP